MGSTQSTSTHGNCPSKSCYRRNFLNTGMYVHLFDSIYNQNYSNYRLFLTDDAFTDGSYLALKKNI